MKYWNIRLGEPIRAQIDGRLTIRFGAFRFGVAAAAPTMSSGSDSWIKSKEGVCHVLGDWGLGPGAWGLDRRSAARGIRAIVGIVRLVAVREGKGCRQIEKFVSQLCHHLILSRLVIPRRSPLSFSFARIKKQLGVWMNVWREIGNNGQNREWRHDERETLRLWAAFSAVRVAIIRWAVKKKWKVQYKIE